jgi:small subunit ribosomal protein S8
MITDPVADFLTRIRNAQQRKKMSIELPSTKMLVAISQILKKEGFILDYEVIEGKPQNTLKVTLKYVNNEPAIRNLTRVSTPGLRRYRGYRDIKSVMSGLGISILSTPKGVITGEEAKELKVGGELICYIS